MADTYRRHALIDAPVEDVWAIVSDPRTHPDWWPEVEAVELSGELEEGGEYVRTTKRLLFRDAVDGIWVAERLDDLKEAHFRCTVSGAYTRFTLTPARDDTFVEIEAGLLPTNVRWRLAKLFDGLYIPGWINDILDRLPSVVSKTRADAAKP